ncbi:hypothetical protein [Sphingomonas sp.]|jgi:hypothetical protein|uniref:hypothetical protein n=1 Tax=Sphingomonas sp. TaxID=28214 RepID=UPI002E327AF7|nr:hypothetical protein [Sphingomonas sp.]HEX4694830.1 hypothetical protein [Sphingomonas sp.]
MDEDVRHEPFPATAKVQVLLAEYSGLKSHIVARTSAAIQASAIGVASLALIVPQLEACPVAGLILLGFLVATVVVIALSIYRDLMAEVSQVRRLETRINNLAGEALLTYETEHGISTRAGSRLWWPNKNSN